MSFLSRERAFQKYFSPISNRGNGETTEPIIFGEGVSERNDFDAIFERFHSFDGLIALYVASSIDL